MDINILVAEDDLLTREKIIADLRLLGFDKKIYEADNGQEAYEILTSFSEDDEDKVHFIVCDLVMPISSGLDFLLRIKKEDRYKSLPFLMLTSNSDRVTIIDCVKSGVSSYLLKPWTQQALAERISSCLTKREL